MIDFVIQIIGWGDMRQAVSFTSMNLYILQFYLFLNNK